jgi:hypothetical protein
MSAAGRLRLSLAAFTLAATTAGAGAWALFPGWGSEPEPGPPRVGPALGVSTNLSQGSVPAVAGQARALGVDYVRDGMSWGLAEREPGLHVFTDKRTAYPDRLPGMELGIVLNWGNPNYDDGATPHSPEGIAAFGAFAGVLAERFPGMTALEIGNEFNGGNFVNGPLRDMPALERARAYVPLLEAAAREARAVRPDLRIVGGAAHSVPGAFLWEMLDAGAAEHMDAIAIHPYTTPAEQIVRQVEVLRRHPAMDELELEVTEFGTRDPADAADHFLRGYCQMALADMARVVWYPFNRRDDGYVPLVERGGTITAAGRAHRQIVERMEGRPVADAGGPGGTYGCRFGDDVLVLWGEGRSVTPAPEVEVLGADGRPVAVPEGGLTLSPQRVLVLVGAGGAELGPPGIVADTFHDYAYPDADGEVAGDGPGRFAPVLRHDGTEHPFVTLPGQERSGVPWAPYLGAPSLGTLRLTARSMLPGRHAGAPVEIVHRYVAPRDEVLRLTADFDVPERSEDGIRVALRVPGAPDEERVLEAATEIVRDGIELSAGDVIEIAVGPNGSPRGDLIGFRYTLRRTAGG